MNTHSGVTLQISLAPTDVPHAKYILPHQLRQWAGQVDEVLLVVDLHRSHGRFSEGWKERLPELRPLIDECCARYSHTHFLVVDYSDEVAATLSSLFFGGQPIPTKDWIGGPFYTYFFGLYAAKHNYVFHMDSDMMYGGGSQTWVAEAVQLLTERSDGLICSPLPGPPTADGRLRSQVLEPEPYTSPAFRTPIVSTRLFLMDRNRFFSRIKKLSLIPPPGFFDTWRALAEGQPPYGTPENVFRQGMAKHGLIRIDFLGCDPGMWSVHPPYRSKLFYDRLPTLIQQIETGEIPEAQRGDYDVNDSMLDWSSARKPLWKRAVKRLKLVVTRPWPFQVTEQPITTIEAAEELACKG